MTVCQWQRITHLICCSPLFHSAFCEFQLVVGLSSLKHHCVALISLRAVFTYSRQMHSELKYQPDTPCSAPDSSQTQFEMS